MKQLIPDIAEVNSSYGDEINGYGQLLIVSFHENGRIVINGQFSERQEKLLPVAAKWLDMVENSVERVGVEHRTAMIDRYDLLHRLVFRADPEMGFVNRVRHSVVESILNGNKNIDLSQVVRMISLSLRSSRTFDLDGSAKSLHDSVLKKWFDDFERTGNFLDMPQKEALQRATTLIGEDISRLTGNPRKVKQAITGRISVQLNNFIEKDADTLRAMARYLRVAGGRYIANDESDTIMSEILGILSVMPSLNRFDRMAYACESRMLTEQF